jgi:RNA-directed DNA polymerase
MDEQAAGRYVVYGSWKKISKDFGPHYTPKLKKRTALLRELKEVFRQHRSQPI